VTARSWLPGYVLTGVIWGCSFAFIEVGLRALTPVQVVFWRLALGAAALLVMVAIARVRLPSGLRTWGHLAVVAVLLNAAPGWLFAFGQQHVSSVIAGILNAMTPLATLAVILAAYPEERPTARRVAGLLTGFLGVAVVIGVWRGLGSGEWSGVLACLAATVCYGLALPYTRRHLASVPGPKIGLVAGQVTLSAVMVLPILLLTGPAPHGEVTPAVVASMVALGTLGSGVAYALNFRTIEVAGPGTASTVTYITPVVAAVVGVVFLGTRIDWNVPVGALVVLAGVAVAQSRPRLPQPTKAPTAV